MSKRRQFGFTLIELMIVCAITAILASIAVAYYGDYIVSARRSDGRSALLDNVTTLEKCKATYGVYDNAACLITVASPDGYYTVTLAAGSDATSFILVATPMGAQAVDNDCATMSMSHLGEQTSTGDDSSKCW